MRHKTTSPHIPRTKQNIDISEQPYLAAMRLLVILSLIVFSMDLIQSFRHIIQKPALNKVHCNTRSSNRTKHYPQTIANKKALKNAYNRHITRTLGKHGCAVSPRPAGQSRRTLSATSGALTAVSGALSPQPAAHSRRDQRHTRHGQRCDLTEARRTLTAVSGALPRRPETHSHSSQRRTLIAPSGAFSPEPAHTEKQICFSQRKWHGIQDAYR